MPEESLKEEQRKKKEKKLRGTPKRKNDFTRQVKHPLSCSDLIQCLVKPKVILHRILEFPTFEPGATTIDNNCDIIQSTSQILVPIATKAEVDQLASSSRAAVSIEFEIYRPSAMRVQSACAGN